MGSNARLVTMRIMALRQDVGCGNSHKWRIVFPAPEREESALIVETQFHQLREPCDIGDDKRAVAALDQAFAGERT